MKKTRPREMPALRSDAPPRVRDLLAVASVSMMVLAQEVALTRAFSVLLRFHYVFLAVSLATCGLGLGGVIDYVLRRRNASAVLYGSGLAAAVLGPTGIALLFASPLSAHLTSLWVPTACCLPAFATAGLFLSRAFTVWGRHSGLLYYADLTGAAAATALIIIALQLGGAVNAILAFASLGAVAALLSVRHWPAAAVAGVLGVSVAWLAFVNARARIVDLPALPLAGDPLAKPLYQELADPSTGARIIYSQWNAFARTDVVVYGPVGPLAAQEDLYVYTDGEVPTNIVQYRGSLDDLAKRYRDFIGLYAFRMVKPRHVMLLGPGGGLDIWLALIVGAERIEGAEVNPAIPAIVRRFADFAGPVYDFNNVRIAVAEGRSYIRSSRNRFDIIYMALTKTATTATTSMALVESYVHTVDAFRDYFRHLTPRGAVAFVCQASPLLVRELLTAIHALELEGLTRQQAVSRIAVASVPQVLYSAGPYRHLLLVYREELDPAHAKRLATEAVACGLEPVFFPRVYEPEPFPLLWDESLDMRRLVDELNARWYGSGASGLNVLPCTDDRPFVVDLTWGVPGPLRRLLWAMLAATTATAVLAALLSPRGGDGDARSVAAALAWPAYFVCLGVAFMIVEVVLIQMFTLFLGYPVLSLATLLFAILLGAGLGALLSQRIPLGAAVPAIAIAVGVLVCLAAAVRTGHPALFSVSAGWSVQARCIAAFALIAPLGAAMGIPFPLGLRLTVDRLGAGVVPWAWAANGLASVVGSALAMAVAKLGGFTLALAIGLGTYLIAILAIIVFRLAAFRHEPRSVCRTL